MIFGPKKMIFLPKEMLTQRPTRETALLADFREGHFALLAENWEIKEKTVVKIFHSTKILPYKKASVAETTDALSTCFFKFML